MRNIITPLEIVDKPQDPYRIAPILEELRTIWSNKSSMTFGEVVCMIINKEYELDHLQEMSDDEFLAAIQNMQKFIHS